MLQDIRDNAQSTVAKVIVGLIVLTFALFGVDSIVGGIGGEPEVATVNGTEITETEFLIAVDRKKRQILNQMGQNADPSLIDDQLLKRSVLDGLIEQKVLLQDAENNGVSVSDGSIESIITSIPQFQVDGEFDNNMFLSAIRNIGLTTQGYKNLVREQVVISQPRNAIVASSFLLDDEFVRVMDIERQTRNYSLIKFSQADYLDQVSVTDEEIESYYDANAADFRTPEAVDVEYIELTKVGLLDQVTVEESVIREIYEQEVEEFEATEERNASHILILVDDDTTESEAQAKAKEIKEKLDQGESFEALAKEFSEDAGSASQGGSLGFSAKGTNSEAFDEALFAMQEGGVSDPILSDYGYHVIKLIEVQSQPIPTFEEMRPSLESDEKAQLAEALYVEMAEQLADVTYASSDLVDPSEELELEIRSRDGVTSLTQDPVLQSSKVQKALFSTEVLKDGNNSEVIEVSDEKMVVVRVSQHYPEMPKSLDTVRDEIAMLLKAKMATEQAVTAGAALSTEIETSGSSQSEIVWESFLDVRRNDFEKSPELVKYVYAMPRALENGSPAISGLEIGGDYYLVRLDQVNVEGVDSLSDAERVQVVGMVSGGIGNAEYQVYQSNLIAKSEIEKL